MAGRKDYAVIWRFDDSHRCDFSGELNFKGKNPEDVLEQFKQTNVWKLYSDANPKYFSYRVEETEGISDIAGSE